MNSRKIDLNILLEIEDGAYSNLLLNKYLKELPSSRDKALITEIVYGVIRYKNRLDYIIKQFSKHPLDKLDKAVLIALRLAIYQLEFLDKIPARAAVNETVKASKGFCNKGAVGFINGVLRNFLRNKQKVKFPDRNKTPREYMIDYLSHPAWLIDYWSKEYQEECLIELCKLNNRAPELEIRFNSIKYNKEQLFDIFEAHNIVLKENKVPDNYIVEKHSGVANLPLYREGGFIVQGAAASLSSQILNPEPGMKVLDMTAAPGGKTTHLAALMENKGEITALDIYPHKIKLIEENCQRLGVSIVNTMEVDARQYSSDQKFDMILLDAPCSGLGLIRHKPEIRWRMTLNDLEELAKLQFQLLEKAISLLTLGGTVLYSTCTLSKKENRNNINKLITKFSGQLEILNIDNDLTRLGIKDNFTACKDGMMELFPVNTDTEGFFMAKIKKTGRIF